MPVSPPVFDRGLKSAVATRRSIHRSMLGAATAEDQPEDACGGPTSSRSDDVEARSPTSCPWSSRECITATLPDTVIQLLSVSGGTPWKSASGTSGTKRGFRRASTTRIARFRRTSPRPICCTGAPRRPRTSRSWLHRPSSRSCRCVTSRRASPTSMRTIKHSPMRSRPTAGSTSRPP